MDVEAVAAAGTGLAVVLLGRIAVGDIDHAVEIAADERLERGAQLFELGHFFGGGAAVSRPGAGQETGRVGTRRLRTRPERR